LKLNFINKSNKKNKKIKITNITTNVAFKKNDLDNFITEFQMSVYKENGFRILLNHLTELQMPVHNFKSV